MTYTPRPDLTPPDLRARGYTIVHGNGFCWQRANRYGAGTVYGSSYDSVDEACHSARRDTVPVGQMMLGLMEVTG